jgi:hypothetical protein
MSAFGPTRTLGDVRICPAIGGKADMFLPPRSARRASCTDFSSGLDILPIRNQIAEGQITLSIHPPISPMAEQRLRE